MAEPVEPPQKPLGPSTLSVHGGEPRPKPANSLATPIIQTATFTFFAIIPLHFFVIR